MNTERLNAKRITLNANTDYWKKKRAAELVQLPFVIYILLILHICNRSVFWN